MQIINLLEIERDNCPFYFGRQHNPRLQLEIAQKWEANLFNNIDLKMRNGR